MSETYVYFRAAGRSLEACRRFLQSRRDCAVARKAVAERYGASGVYVENEQLAGLRAPSAEAEPPTGFRCKLMRIQRDGLPQAVPVWIPDKRIQNGRNIQREFSGPKYRLAGWPEVSRFLGGGMVIAGSRLHWPVLLQYGDTIVIRVAKPESSPAFVPQDAEAMPASEYWKLVETHGGKEQAIHDDPIPVA